MVYECIKAFSVDCVDDNDFCIEDNGEQIQKALCGNRTNLK